jgi:ankyrin repeat protein
MDVALPEALVDAAVAGAFHAVAAWLDESGGVDAGCAEHEGLTLLMAAAGGGQEATVRMLLQRGASVNLQKAEGITALMSAAVHGHTTIVQALLDAKADASLQATGGGTALMLAEEEEHAATAQLLRQHTKQQAVEAVAAVAHATAAAPTPSLSGRRVRIDGLKGRPDGGEAVLLKPANLQEVLEPALHSP